jgi:hypothetical protein
MDGYDNQMYYIPVNPQSPAVTMDGTLDDLSARLDRLEARAKARGGAAEDGPVTLAEAKRAKEQYIAQREAEEDALVDEMLRLAGQDPDEEEEEAPKRAAKTPAIAPKTSERPSNDDDDDDEKWVKEMLVLGGQVD